MHMADALISPVVGGTMLAASGAAMAIAARRIMAEGDDRKVPLMGVLGAFIFAAQMVNFTIPGTGSSGHLGGGMILAALLGPWSAFLVMASVLTVQALFFADGGLLALGCNIVNLGAFPAFIAYPLVFRPLVGRRPTAGRLVAGSLAASVVGLQLGSSAVVLQTVLSGVSELPFKSFLWLMQPIHLAIGIVEGLATAAVVSFVWRARPEVLDRAADCRPAGFVSLKPVLVTFGVLALLSGGLLSWFASTNPDGLEWSIARITGKGELEGKDGAHKTAAAIQGKTAFLPGYDLPVEPSPDGDGNEEGPIGRQVSGIKREDGLRTNRGATFSGILGGVLTLALAGAVGILMSKKRGRTAP